MRRLFGIAIAVAALACGTTYGTDQYGPPIPPTTVAFALDAPLCSSILRVQLSIDKAIVATDTFVTYGNPKDTVSRRFSVQAGAHSLSANVIGGFVWPEKVVTVHAGEAYVDTLPFYCS